MPTRLKVLRPQSAFSPVIRRLSIGATVTVNDDDAVALVNDGVCVRYVEGLDDNVVNWVDVAGGDAAVAAAIAASGGLQPVAVDYRGAYNNGDGTYAVGSVVLFNGLLYKKISNPGNPGYPPGGTDWQLFKPLIGSPAYDLWVQTSFDNVRNPLLDAVGTPSVDFYDRNLLATTGIVTVDWENCYLNDPDDVQAVDWYYRYMLDSSARSSINWDERKLYNDSENNTINWNISQLLSYDGYSNYLSIDWFNRLMYDATGTQTLNWAARVLYDSNVYEAVNWNSGTLSSSEVVRVDWSNGVLSDIDGFPMLNWETGEVSDTLHDPTLNWTERYLYKQWQTVGGAKVAGNVMSNAQYLPTTNTGGTYNMAAPANAGMVILHQAASGGLIASMTLQLHGATSALDSVPVGGDMSFTSRYGVTGLTVTYGTGNVLLGTPVTTCAAGATITWRKLAVIGTTTYIARLT